MVAIHEITLRNLLSFGPDSPPLPLQDLNVLIGPNGSGKSNLIEAISLLRAAPTNLATPVREGGGIRDWIWKGDPGATASIDVVVKSLPKRKKKLRHVIEFRETTQRFDLVGELLEDKQKRKAGRHCYFKNGTRNERPTAKIRVRKYTGKSPIMALAKGLAPNESILSQRKDPEKYAEITYLGGLYRRFRMYRDWSFGPYTALRQPQKVDQRNDFLKSDGTNLGLVLNRLRREASVKQSILEYLRELYDGIEDYDDSVEGGTIQVFFHESSFEIPATRLSDGTLRYLCLLAILCHPEPPPLVCIEEPELGLHPDIIPTIARLLCDASKRTQLIVTTHSDILVDALSETPGSIVVCEKHDGQTVMKRLEPDKLAKWLEKYRLGELWIDGEIGGTR